MPKKGKTHKGCLKRIRVSAKGKLRHKSAGAGHLMSGKSGNRKRKLRKPRVVAGKTAITMKELMGAL